MRSTQCEILNSISLKRLIPEIPPKDVGRSPDSGYLSNLNPAITTTSRNKTFSITTAERIRIDIYGCDVLERVLLKTEGDLLVETIIQIELDFHMEKGPPKANMLFILQLRLSSGLTIYPILLHVSATT